jgi:hypothetical protein
MLLKGKEGNINNQTRTAGINFEAVLKVQMMSVLILLEVGTAIWGSLPWASIVTGIDYILSFIFSFFSYPCSSKTLTAEQCRVIKMKQVSTKGLEATTQGLGFGVGA